MYDVTGWASKCVAARNMFNIAHSAATQATGAHDHASRRLFTELGYVRAPNAQSVSSRESLDLGKILDWRGVVDQEVRAYWSELLACEHICFDAVRDQVSPDARG